MTQSQRGSRECHNHRGDPGSFTVMIGPGRFRNLTFRTRTFCPDFLVLDQDVSPPDILDQNVSPPDFLDHDVSLPDILDLEVSPP